MNCDDPQHLSQLATRWTLIAQAIRDQHAAKQAIELTLPSYCKAVYCYVLAIMQDPLTAEDVAQEFALRFIRGDFRHARPEKGRFRDYVKIAILHLVNEFRKRAARQKLYPLDSKLMRRVADADLGAESCFHQEWRQELINRAWAKLRDMASRSPSFYEVLRLKTDQPEMSSAQIAEQFSTRFGVPLTAGNIRQILHRAREHFGLALCDAVRSTLTIPTEEALREELADLGLLRYCPTATAQESLQN